MLPQRAAPALPCPGLRPVEAEAVEIPYPLIAKVAAVVLVLHYVLVTEAHPRAKLAMVLALGASFLLEAYAPWPVLGLVLQAGIGVWILVRLKLD